MPIRHKVVQGDTVIGLSEKYGLFADTIWNAPENKDLKREREDMNVLAPGDILVIPDKREQKASKATGKSHKFKRKGIPAIYRVQLFDIEEPRSGQDYTFIVDGDIREGKLDDDGVLEEYVPATAKKADLTVGPDEAAYEILFGDLNPADDLSGAQQRLNNLGYTCGSPSGEMNDETRTALAKFQARFDLETTGNLDDDTIKKLEAVHDAGEDFPDDESAG